MILGIDASRYQYDEPTGVEWYSFHIINELVKLVKNRADLEVILYAKPGQSLTHLEGENVKVKVIDRNRLWTIKGLSKEMRLNPPNVLFVPSHALPIRLPVRSVVTIHDVAFKHFEKAYDLKARAYLDWTTKFGVRMATKIIVPSQATAKDLIEKFGCNEMKLKVIEHGFKAPEIKPDLNLFNSSEALSYFNLGPDIPYFLFIGRLEKKKNLVRLIESFKNFSETNPDYHLVLAGKRGVGFEEIMATVKRLDLMDKVDMPGYINEAEKATLFEYCRGFVFPSLYEGFGLPVLESFYYQKPVLVSIGSALEEVAGDAAIIVDPKNVENITEGLFKLIDQNLASGIVKKGNERLKNYSWENAAKETLKILLKEYDK